MNIMIYLSSASFFKKNFDKINVNLLSKATSFALKKAFQYNIKPEDIYHNVSLRAPPKRAERDSDADTAKEMFSPG